MDALVDTVAAFIHDKEEPHMLEGRDDDDDDEEEPSPPRKAAQHDRDEL